jgi:hypothetical protein
LHRAAAADTFVALRLGRLQHGQPAASTWSRVGWSLLVFFLVRSSAPVVARGCFVARKSSDMVLLLGSRGQYRGRNAGFLPSLRSSIASFFGRVGGGRQRRESRGRRSSSSSGAAVSGLAILALLLVGFVGGFFVRGQFVGAAAKEGNAGLKAGPQAPEIVGEMDTSALASQAFIVSAYPGIEPATARQHARHLSDYLRGQQLAKARPYEYPSQNGPLWVVAVYFDGDAEQAATREKLRLLPLDVPDATFCQLRKPEADWPLAVPIQ